MKKLQYPLIVSDFDGTLARGDKSVSAFTKSIIAEYIARGGCFTIATGRSREGILSQLDKVGLDGDIPIASYQGGLIELAKSGKVLSEQFLSRETAVRVVQLARKSGLEVQTYFGGKTVVEKDFEDLFGYCLHNAMRRALVPDLAEFCAGHDVYKVLVHIPADFEATATAFDSLASACKVTRTARTYLEFYPNTSGKGYALDILANYYGVPRECTMTFGDQANDIELLAAAGFGVAVENAVPELKSVADYITLSNEADGVAHAMRKLCYR